ncbi:MAG TPA: ABC transporter permease [Gemmataceae bacterium]|jgi:ABC-type polysaccharide/polyol phosphate export permease
MTVYVGAIWKCRFFWLSLVKMDLASRYRGSVLGICWSLLHPIAMTAILCVVFKYAFKMPNMRTYAPLLFTGLTFWGFFSSVLVQGCGCFFHGESYIRQFPAPMAIYPLRTVLGSAFHFAIGLLLAIGIALLAGPAEPEEFKAAATRQHPAQVQTDSSTERVPLATPEVMAVLKAVGKHKALSDSETKTVEKYIQTLESHAPKAEEKADKVDQAPEGHPTRAMQLMALPTLLPTLLLLLLFGWSMAILFGLLNVRFRDTRHLVEIGLQGLFYLTPIMYPIQAMEGRFLGKLLHYNPLTPILDLLIQPILYGRIPSLTTYAVAGLIVLSLSVTAAFALKIEERRLIFHL